MLCNLEALTISFTAIEHINTTNLVNLLYLNAHSTFLLELDTKPLKKLQKLFIYKTNIKFIETTSLLDLIILYAGYTNISRL